MRGFVGRALAIETSTNERYLLYTCADSGIPFRGWELWRKKMDYNYEIRREAHAIGEFTATLRFFGSVGVKTFAKVVPLLNEAAGALKLPAPMPAPFLNISIGNAPARPAPTSGSGFQRFAANGEILSSLWCDQESISFTLREYERWHKALPTLVQTFSRLASAYIDEVPAIHNFSVQYLNEFRAKQKNVSSTAELFQRDSKWIAPFSFDSEQPWHCHVGQFIPSERDFRYLVNMNVDVLPVQTSPDSATMNYVKVLILAACQYDLANKGPLIAQAENLPALIESNFNAAHAMEKTLLNEVISSEYIAILGEGADEY